jgi:hypothetical protein
MKIRRSVGELIQGIEAGYLPEERQFKNLSVGNPDDTIAPGLTGNAWFTSSQLERLKRFKAARQVIYRKLGELLPVEIYQRVLRKIDEGFLILHKDIDQIRSAVAAYRAAERAIRDCVLKQNAVLAQSDDFFETCPIVVSFDHPFKNAPAISGRPGQNRSVFINALSRIIEPYLGNPIRRSELISAILKSFYGETEADASPRSIRREF